MTRNSLLLLIAIVFAVSVQNLDGAQAQQKPAKSIKARASFAPSSKNNQLLPPNAKSGECYARVFQPPKYENITEQVLMEEAGDNVEVIPAEYDWQEQKLISEEASYRLEVLPATYEWVEEKVEISPATERLTKITAQYEWVEEKVIDKPAHTVWKKGRGLVEKVDNGTGEVMCKIDVPATYKNVRKKILKTPSSVDRVAVPAQYRTVRKKIMKSPPSTKKIEIPAKYELVRVKKLIKPAEQKITSNKPKYQTITRTQIVGEGKMAWQPVLCETNLNPTSIKAIQSALRKQGYKSVRADGVLGGSTIRALKAFQKAKGLAVGGATIEALELLGVNI